MFVTDSGKSHSKNTKGTYKARQVVIRSAKRPTLWLEDVRYAFTYICVEELPKFVAEGSPFLVGDGPANLKPAGLFLFFWLMVNGCRAQTTTYPRDVDPWDGKSFGKFDDTKTTKA